MKKIAAELEEIRYIKALTFVDADRDRRVIAQTEMTQYENRLSDQERKLYREEAIEADLHKEISCKIEELRDEDERDVLFYRYIKGMEFFKIAEAMN